MGIGDWILASAEARHFHEVHGLPVVFANRTTRHVFWSEVFENNPKILEEPQSGQQVCVVENYPGKRPYIRAVTKERFLFDNGFMIEPGEIFLSDAEKQEGIEGAVLVEPHTKTEMGLSRNKAWPWERWQELVKTVDAPWVQLTYGDKKALDGVRVIHVERFRESLPYIAKSSLVVTTDSAISLTKTSATRRTPAGPSWIANTV
jgi:ADP-heptose:LPS heptosyltransferase